MKNLFWTWPNALSDEDCDYILDKAKEEETIAGTTFNGEDNIRRSNIKWINDELIHSTIWKLGNRVNSAGFGFDLYHSINDIQFTEYSHTDKGTYNWHVDSHFGENSNDYSVRKLSIIIQLTDPSEYDGGDIQLNIAHKPEELGQIVKLRGTLIAFPSFILHKITPITKGTRNSLVSWFEGPSWR